MSWIRDVALALLITSAAGSLLFLAWAAIVYAGRGKRDIRRSYWMLRGVLAGYLLSLMYLIIRQYMEYIKNQHDILSVATVPLDRLFFVFFLVWLTGGLARAVFQMSMWKYFKEIEKGRMLVPKEYRALLQKLCGELQIKKPVCLYQGHGVQTPFISGVRHPAIYLPVGELPEEGLEMILYHELVHYKQGDTFWKPVFGLVENIYWFNPLSRLFGREAARWTEANCDFQCCEERFDTKKYFTLLLDMGTAQGVPVNRYTPRWSESGTELIWRMHRIKGHFSTKTGAAFVAVLAAVSIFCGGIAAHAAFQGVEMLYGQAYSKTVEGAEVYLPPEDMIWQCHAYNQAVDELFIKKRQGINQKGAEGFSDVSVVNWSIRPKEAYYSEAFYVESGGDIKVRIAIQPIRNEVQLGIVQPDGEISYVTGRNFISCIFCAPETGFYKVFLSNIGRKEVTAEGSYMIRSQRRGESIF